MRGRGGALRETRDARDFYGNYSVLILQDAIDRQETLAEHRELEAVEDGRRQDGVTVEELLGEGERRAEQ